MSGVSTAYDAMVARVATVLPSHKRIANPYKIDTNPIAQLERGFGVRIGSGNNAAHLINKHTISRDFGVVLTRKIQARENDSTLRSSAEKSLMEDLLLVIQGLCNDDNLNGGAIVVNTRFQADTGVGFIDGQAEGFLFVEAAFTVEYFESYS